MLLCLPFSRINVTLSGLFKPSLAAEAASTLYSANTIASLKLYVSPWNKTVEKIRGYMLKMKDS